MHGLESRRKEERNIFYCQAFLSDLLSRFYLSKNLFFTLLCKGIHNKIHFKGKKRPYLRKRTRVILNHVCVKNLLNQNF